MRRYLSAILVVVFLVSCAGSATTVPPTWTPEAPKKVQMTIEVASTTTDEPTFTPIPPTFTPTATPFQVANDYALQATQSIEHVFASMQDAANLLLDAVKTDSLDGIAFEHAIDSMNLSAQSVCSLNAPDRHASLHAVFQRICTQVGELESALHNGVKAQSITLGDLTTPLTAIGNSMKDYIDASSALGLDPPQLNIETATTTSTPTEMSTIKATATQFFTKAPTRTSGPTRTPAPTRTLRPTSIPTVFLPPTDTPAPIVVQPTNPPAQACCKVCTTGKACGNSCIAANKTCHQPPGCACNG